MKAIVLEVKDGKTAVLREDGVVLKVRGTYPVGETIELNEKPRFSFRTPQMRMVFTAAAIILAVTLGGIYSYTTVQAASIIAVEGDAGVELVLNRRNQVIEIRATDEAGETLRQELENRHVIGTSFTNAVEAASEIHEEKFPENTDGLTFRVTSKNEHLEQQLTEELKELEEKRPKDNPPSENNPPVTDEPNTAAPAPQQEERPQDRPAENSPSVTENNGPVMPEPQESSQESDRPIEEYGPVSEPAPENQGRMEEQTGQPADYPEEKR